MNNHSARIVAIEGINGAGKTTQSALLCNTLKQHGLATELIKFPNYHSITGQLIRSLITQQSQVEPSVLFALFAANRLESKNRIVRFLSSTIVVADRYSESEYAYGLAEGLPEYWLLSLESLMPQADLVIVLDLEPTLALSRVDITSTKDVFEEDLGFTHNVRQRYLELAARPPRNQQHWEVVDASQPISRVQDTIVDIVMELASPMGR